MLQVIVTPNNKTNKKYMGTKNSAYAYLTIKMRIFLVDFTLKSTKLWGSLMAVETITRPNGNKQTSWT